MGVFAACDKVRTKDFRAGDVGYVPRAMGHYVENTGKTDLVFLEVFRSSYYSSISFAQWLSHLPPELVQAHFGFSDDTMKRARENAQSGPCPSGREPARGGPTPYLLDLRRHRLIHQIEQPPPGPTIGHDSPHRRQWIKSGPKVRASTRR
jgi:hypothetical protein